jgi:hypothetical protein
MAEDEDLEVLGAVVPVTLAAADEETDEGAGDEVEERPHQPIVPVVIRARIGVSDPHEVIRTPFRAPNANAHAERVIETIRAECLDWTLILGRRQLDQTLRIYAEHYNRQRPHRAIRLATPLGGARVPVPVSPRDVRWRDLLGGLIHEYHGLAA